MDGLFWLREEQLEKIQPFFPKSRGVSRAPCGPYKTLTNRFRRWWEKGIFQVVPSGLAPSADPGAVVGALDLTAQTPLQPPNPLTGRTAVGLAFDGDGDRLAAVDEAGAFCSTQLLIPLLINHLGRDSTRPGVVVKTVSGSDPMTTVAEDRGRRVVETAWISTLAISPPATASWRCWSSSHPKPLPVNP